MEHRLWLTSLTQHIVEAWQDCRIPTMPSCSRAKADQAVEYMLVNPLELHNHLMLLAHLLTPEFPYKETLGTTKRAVLAKGLSSLLEEELAQLLLNPLALIDLAHSIESQQPGYWLNIREKPPRSTKKPKFCL